MRKNTIMPKQIDLIVHGSTGSIGTQTLDVVEKLRGKKDFHVFALICNNNAGLMAEQILKFKPEYAVVVNEGSAEKVRDAVARRTDTIIMSGEEEGVRICGHMHGGYVVVATSGFAGLAPTLEAINAKNTVAVANKEAFLTAGNLIWAAARRSGVEVLPIDSEPSAIWQSIEGDVFVGADPEAHSAVWKLQRGARHNVRKMILTCSGGPFNKEGNRLTYEQMKDVTPEAALNHPNWKMGDLITIRSATLMNKGMERIEIASIFNMPLDDIEIVVHPQSIVHSGIETTDGIQKVQQGPHDMRYPISYALTFPRRYDLGIGAFSLFKDNRFSFEEPDYGRFPSLRIAYEAGKAGGTAPTALNGADETVCDLFMRRKIRFTDMAEITEAVVKEHVPIQAPDLKQILRADSESRGRALEVAKDYEARFAKGRSR